MPSLVEIGPVVLEKKISKRQFIFTVSQLSPLVEEHGSSFQQLNPLYPWLRVSGEEDFFKVVNVFLLFLNYLPMGKGIVLYLNKLQSASPKDALFQVWL